METWVIVAIVIGIIFLFGCSFGGACVTVGSNGNKSSSCKNSTRYSSCGGGQGQLALFYTDWCGYCKKLKPIWKRLENEFGSTLVGIDADKDGKLKQAYGVEGYPSIYWCPKGVRHSAKIAEPYDGSRDEESIRNFINRKLN